MRSARRLKPPPRSGVMRTSMTARTTPVSSCARLSTGRKPSSTPSFLRASSWPFNSASDRFSTCAICAVLRLPPSSKSFTSGVITRAVSQNTGLNPLQTLISEIHKLHRHGKFVGAHGGDDGLQFVAALAVHAHLVALNLRGHLELAVADEAGDLLGYRALDAVLDLDALPRVAERRDVRLGLLDAFHADTALGQSADDDLIQRADFELVVGGELDLGFLQHDLPFAGFEVEAVGQLLFGLVDGVFDFHRVDLRNNVE